MINKVGFSPAFQGAKEVKAIKEQVAGKEFNTHTFDSVTNKLESDLFDGKVSTDDIKEAAQQVENPWKKNLSKFAKAFEELF